MRQTSLRQYRQSETYRPYIKKRKRPSYWQQALEIHRKGPIRLLSRPVARRMPDIVPFINSLSRSYLKTIVREARHNVCFLTFSKKHRTKRCCFVRCFCFMNHNFRSLRSLFPLCFCLTADFVPLLNSHHEQRNLSIFLQKRN